MCGFTGIWRFRTHASSIDEKWLVNHLFDMKYRGPDETCIQKEGDNLILGFNRLAIRDLSKLGSQPFRSKSRNSLLVFNGEIYNTIELLNLAKIPKSYLRGNSDTEILIECAEKKGLEWVLKYADGIFALAFFDTKKNILKIARDHVGVKPLYLALNEDMCLFSSEYNPILNHPVFSNPTINPKALQGYFQYGFIQEGEGLIENTFFVQQGHLITIFNDGTWKNEPYDDNIENLKRSFDKKQIDEILSDVVAEQMISDVPLGSFISGGVDSVLVSHYASLNVKSMSGYTISVQDKKLDESKNAKILTRLIGGNIKHFIDEVKDQTILESLTEFKNSMGEPLNDYSSLLMLQVSKISKKNITVALSGDGGDELFFGYPRFSNALKRVGFFEKNQFLKYFNILKSRLSNNPIPISLLKFKNFYDYYLSKQGVTGNRYFTSLLLKKFDKNYRPYHYDFLTQKINDPIEFARAIETKIHLQRILLKVDRASMYKSLEVRVPLLSKKVIALSKLYNVNDCIDEKSQKLPLKKLLFNKLGGESFDIIYGKKKGFEPPLGTWLRNELKLEFQQILFNPPKILEEHINFPSIKVLWDDHQSNYKDNSNALWALFALFVWINKNITSHENQPNC